MFEMLERGDPKKMYVIIGQQRWLINHAEQKDEHWYCKSSNAQIAIKFIGRSIWLHIWGTAMAGIGEVRQVAHFYCPACEAEPDIAMGTPIYDVELQALDPVRNELVSRSPKELVM